MSTLETTREASERLNIPVDRLRLALQVFEVPVREKRQATPGRGPQNTNVYAVDDVDVVVALLHSFKPVE